MTQREAAARQELQALAALIRRPPLDDVQLEQDVALRIASAIDVVTAAPAASTDALILVTDDKGYFTLHEPDEDGNAGDLVFSAWGDNWPKYLATTPPTTNDAIPAGWKLVPEKPTADQIVAGEEGNPTCWSEETDNGFAADVANDVYISMLAAAPKPSPTPKGGLPERGEVSPNNRTMSPEEDAAYRLLFDQFASEGRSVTTACVQGRSLRIVVEEVS